jgi:hypothetical protein
MDKPQIIKAANGQVIIRLPDGALTYLADVNLMAAALLAQPSHGSALGFLGKLRDENTEFADHVVAAVQQKGGYHG